MDAIQPLLFRNVQPDTSITSFERFSLRQDWDLPVTGTGQIDVIEWFRGGTRWIRVSMSVAQDVTLDENRRYSTTSRTYGSWEYHYDGYYVSSGFFTKQRQYIDIDRPNLTRNNSSLRFVGGFFTNTDLVNAGWTPRSREGESLEFPIDALFDWNYLTISYILKPGVTMSFEGIGT